MVPMVHGVSKPSQNPQRGISPAGTPSEILSRILSPAFFTYVALCNGPQFNGTRRRVRARAPASRSGDHEKKR